MVQLTLTGARPLFMTIAAAAIAPAFGVAAWAQPPVPAERQTLQVDRPDDDTAQGSLRWAVEQSNAAPGHFVIRVGGGPAPLHIVLKSGLPPLKNGTVIEGASHDLGPGYDIIDGSGYIAYDVKSCPGLEPNQYGANVHTLSNPGLAVVDGSHVEISGLEITRFCIGILVLRSDHVDIHDSRITRNVGGAGVMFTSDDGAGNVVPGRTTDNRLVRNVLIGNGDGAELTRGASFTLFADNLFDAGEGNPEPSQGVEILRGDDNVLVRNEFRNYSDGIQVNNGNRNYLADNRLHDNAFGLSLTGVGNVADGNDIFANRFGIVIRSQKEVGGARLTRNIVHDNGKPISRCAAGGSCDPLPDHGPMGIAFRVAPVPPGRGAPVAQPIAPVNVLPPPPQLTAISRGTDRRVQGIVPADPRSAATVEVFGAAAPGEAGAYLGTVTVPPGAGERPFALPVQPGAWRYLTATATTAGGVTSGFAAPLAVPR